MIKAIRTLAMFVLVQLLACHGVSEREHRRGSHVESEAGAPSSGGSAGGGAGGVSGMGSGGLGDAGEDQGGAAGAGCVPDEPCVLDEPCWQGVTDCSSGEPTCNMDDPQPLAAGTSCGPGVECTSDHQCRPPGFLCPSSTSDVAGCGLVALGENHVCALRAQGRVKCWGSNSFGQLGHGDNSSPSSTNRGDEPDEMGDTLPFVDLGTDQRATQVVAGPFYSCALLESGAIKCWGENTVGQLGVGDTDHRGDDPDEMGDALPSVSLPEGRIAVSITAGGSHACALLDNAQISCWGGNEVGALGTGDTLPLGTTEGELPTVNLGSHTARMVSAGGLHTCAILDDESLACWGDNKYGALGFGDAENRGDALDEIGDDLAIVPLGTDAFVKKVSASGGYTCALLDTDELKCWGYNSYGNLGMGTNDTFGTSAGEVPFALSGIALGTDRHAIALPPGGSQTMCAILDDGLLKCWGRNQLGQLGQGDTSARGNVPGEMNDALEAVELGAPNPTVAAVAIGLWTTCAVLESGEAKCWGSNAYGQLGRGDVETIGNADLQMGTYLDPIDLGTP